VILNIELDINTNNYMKMLPLLIYVQCSFPSFILLFIWLHNIKLLEIYTPSMFRVCVFNSLDFLKAPFSLYTSKLLFLI